jgi:phosphatidylserine/phosphatidylglycerophosphate/cardiolipin synthase-like enzyme
MNYRISKSIIFLVSWACLVICASGLAFAGRSGDLLSTEIVGDAENYVIFHYDTEPDADRQATFGFKEIQKLYQIAQSGSKNGTIDSEYFLSIDNQVGDLLQGPNDIFLQMLQQIQTAQREILFATFIWESDSLAAHMLQDAFAQLQRKIRENPRHYQLPLKLKMVDSQLSPAIQKLLSYTGSFGMGKKGGETAGSYGLGFSFDLDPALIQIEHAVFYHKLNDINHTKYLIIDNQSAVLTGSNVQNRGNLELGVSAVGPVVQSLRSDFQELWDKSKIVGSNISDVPLQKTALLIHPYPQYIYPNPLGEKTKIMVLTRKAKINVFGRSTDNPQDLTYLRLFQSAKKSIRILTPNLNFSHCSAILIDALARGVDVQIVLSKNFNQTTESKFLLQGGPNDSIAAKIIGRYAKLKKKESAVAPGVLQIKWFADAAGEVSGGPAGTSHAKYLAIDDEITVLGSTNLDTQSWYASRELDFLIPNASITQKWIRELFIPVFARSKSVN